MNEIEKAINIEQLKLESLQIMVDGYESEYIRVFKMIYGEDTEIDKTDLQKGKQKKIESLNHQKIIIDALRAEQERKELAFEHGFDITNADGSEIDYDALGLKYKDRLCYCDIDGFYIGEDGDLVLIDDCGSCVWIDRKDYCIKARSETEK
jgi:hypothetical protein